MIPLKNDAAGKGIPFVTVLLILSCVVTFVFQSKIRFEGLVPVDFLYALFHPQIGFHKALTTLVISFFLHGSLLHLISNMSYLWIFGSALEKVIGQKNYTILYLLCGIAAMIAQVASSPLSNIPIIGASGAIAGLMGISLILIPMSKVLVYIPPVFLLRIPAFVFLLLWFFIQYANIRWGDHNSSIAWWAHIGGYCTGLFLAVFLRIRGLQPRTAKASSLRSRS